MGGREWRQSPVRHRNRDRWILTSRDDPGGVVHGEGSESRERDRGREQAIVKGRRPRSCSVVVLFRETALEEPFTTAEGG